MMRQSGLVVEHKDKVKIGISRSFVFLCIGLLLAIAVGYFMRRSYANYWFLYTSIGTYPGDIWYIHMNYSELLRQNVFFSIEYPAGMFIYFKLATYVTLFFDQGFSYETWFAVNAVFLTGFALSTTWLIYRLRSYLKPEPATWRMWVFWVVAPSMFFYSLLNFDMPAIFFTMLAVYFRFRDNDDWAAISLGLGVVAKIYPIVLIPLFLIGKKPRDAVKFCLIAGGVWLLVNSSFMLLDFKAWAFSYIWQTTREPTQDGPVWLIWRFFGTRVASLFLPILYIATLAVVIKRSRNMGILGITEKTRLHFIGFAAAMLLAFLLANRIFSPQYILWVLPFFALMPRLSLATFYTFDIINVTLTLLLFKYLAPASHVFGVNTLRFIRYSMLILMFWQSLRVWLMINKEKTSLAKKS